MKGVFSILGPAINESKYAQLQMLGLGAVCSDNTKWAEIFNSGNICIVCLQPAVCGNAM